MPVTKTTLPADDTIYSPSRHKRHTLFNGTQVLQTRSSGLDHVTAVVTAVGMYVRNEFMK